MNTRNSNESGDRLAIRIRAAALIVVVGSLAAVLYPTHHAASTMPLVQATAFTSTAPDMTVYFPDRFPAPQGPIEPLPPQF